MVHTNSSLSIFVLVLRFHLNKPTSYRSSFTLSLWVSAMVTRGLILLLGFLAFFPMSVLSVMAECPLDLGASNFTLAASLCSNEEDRAKCCRYINAFIAVSIARYANASTNLGVTHDLSDICLRSISQTMELYGVPRNATASCGYGTKITVMYECKGRTTVTQMLLSPRFSDVQRKCQVPLSGESVCRRCLHAGIIYLHHQVGRDDNLTLSNCRDAAYAALASQVDNALAVDIASCFFQVQGLNMPPGLTPPTLAPEAFPRPYVSDSPSQNISGMPLNETHHHPYHLTLVPGIGIAVTVFAMVMLVVLVIVVRRKSRKGEETENADKATPKAFPTMGPMRKCQDGSFAGRSLLAGPGPTSMFQKFSYNETKKATDNFSTVIGQGGFGTVYKAVFSDGMVVAVKRMNRVSAQAESEFCGEIELLARLHHRHLVSLRGFCSEKHERFLMYEYMSNGSLKDHLHTPGKTPLSWQTRIQIAIDVANALEYLHFYCDPPLCHRDIKSSNILLDENFSAKVADFGLTHASKVGSIVFEPVNTDIRGTPGYMDPEYVVTQELTEKSDVYSYGVVLLEMVTGRRAIQDNRNVVEWSQIHMLSQSKLAELVDPRLTDSFNFEQLQTVVTIVKWCTQREGKDRPSIKQVLRLLYESSDPMDGGLIQAMEDGEFEGSESRGKPSKEKIQNSDLIYHSGDAKCLASSSSASRSCCSRSFLLEIGSPQSLHNILRL